MERTLIIDTPKKVGEKVKLEGWVDSIRDHGKITFIDLRDIGGVVQCVGKDLSNIGPEFVVELVGKVANRPDKLINVNIDTGKIEIQIEEVKVLSTSKSEFPISMNQYSNNESDQQIRLDWRFLDLRNPKNRLIFETWTTLEQGFRNYWTKNGYIEIHSPKFIEAASESGAELFEVKYFDRKAYLAQSPQFYKQMAMAAGFEKVFEVGPVFRANPSFTSRHDTEFTMYDIEISFINSHLEVMAEEEKAIEASLREVKEKYGEKIKNEFGHDLVVPKLPFPVVTMKKAKEILAGLNIPRETEDDLNPEEERQLCKYILEKEGHEFVFVTEYPISARPFYHMRLESDPNLTKSFDLLWNGIEITTGAQREHRLEILERQAKEKKLSLKSIGFYLDFFKFGMPPHGGCAIGPSRMLMKIFNLPNVREVTYLYRGINRLSP
jgi:aspartyl/asparaginyl-tRNA synthetase